MAVTKYEGNWPHTQWIDLKNKIYITLKFLL